MRIFLTGFMGSGKSHVGRRLGMLSRRPFIDLDDWITQRENQSIADIFEQRGEAGFRDIEAEVLRNFDRVDYFVLATGGGTPCHSDNMEWMNACGRTVFLDPSVQLLEDRLQHERDHRPLLNNDLPLFELIEGLLRQRRPCYERAEIHLRLADPNADVARLIMDSL